MDYTDFRLTRLNNGKTKTSNSHEIEIREIMESVPNP